VSQTSVDRRKAILAGRPSEALVLEQMERPLPPSWDEQQRTMSVFIATDGRPLVKSPPALKAG